MVWTWNLDHSYISLKRSFWKKILKFCWRQHFIAKFRILLISADVSKIWKKNYAKMFLLMIYNYGPNFMFIPLAKLELFKKQILLTSAFFYFCGFSRKSGPKQLGNTSTRKLHHGTLRIRIQSLVCSFSAGNAFHKLWLIFMFFRHAITHLSCYF